MKNKHIGSRLNVAKLAKTGRVDRTPNISKVAKKIESLVVRARANGKAVSRVANIKVECYVTDVVVRSQSSNYARRTQQRLYFRADDVRISRFDLLAYLDDALSI